MQRQTESWPKLKFSNKEQVDVAITNFKTIHSSNYQEIREQYFSLFGHFHLTVNYFKKEALKSLKVYRSRLCSDVQSPDLISEFMHPENDVYSETGRANWKGRNVFYASDSPFCSLTETKAAYEGTEFYIAEWMVDTDSIELEKIPYSTYAIGNMDKNNPWNDVLMKQEDFVSWYNNYTKTVEGEMMYYLISELSKLYTELDKDKYHITAFLADQVIYSSSNQPFPNILIYPSVQSSNSCNFAIHPDFVQNMKLNKVLKVKINEEKDVGYNVLWSTVGLIEENKVKYFDRRIDPKSRTYTIDSISCQCGNTIRIKNPDTQTMLRISDSIQVSFKDAVESQIYKHLSDEEFYSNLPRVFDYKKLARQVVAEVNVPLSDHQIRRQGNTHNNLFAICRVYQKIDYIPI